MIEDCNRWVESSIFKHFSDALTGQAIWFQGQPRNKSEPAERYEVRILGPDWSENGSEFLTKFRVNVVVRSVIDYTDPQHHSTRVGNVLPHLRCISIYKYGDQPTDNQSLVTVAQRRQEEEITVTHFDVVDPVTSVVLTTLEASFSAYIQKG